ncbi:MAG: glucan biosynthesis protein [Gammaproteobacteria bacterium]
MRRRDMLQAGAALPLFLLAGQAGPSQVEPFDGSTVRGYARQLAQAPFKPPSQDLPDVLAKLDYQDYRAIRFDPARALWHDLGVRFSAQFFHRGFLYKDRVDIYEVVDGRAMPILYRPDLFTYDRGTLPTGDFGFAGFRLHYPINRPDYQDEVCAFLGASYFRAVAKGQGYGLSARGLALKTADQGGEEFPLFRAFWLERPAPNADLVVVHALLDSVSAAASFRFTIRPGEATIFDTEMALYPRVDITQAGVAPLTSMFMFDANDRTGVDDWRPAVHDSLGLELRTGRDERIWRPLTNPRELQVSAFGDNGPRGFGLMQRKRALTDFEDLESRYEKRPSLWVEPIGDWSAGAVHLIEIPSDREVNDNIVAFWRPREPLRAKGEYLMSNRLHWCWAAPDAPKIAAVAQTRSGMAWERKHRQFVIDFAGPPLAPWTGTNPPGLEVVVDKGRVVNATAQPIPERDGWRVSIELDPGGNKVVELQTRLMDGERPVTEKWMYRWTPG